MRLASLWTDGAVVQRNKPIVVWGWADAKRVVVKASLGSSEAAGATSWDGRFELRLPALPAGGPYELKVETIDGAEACVVKNILVGEVWLVSGQSNAEFPLMAFELNDPQSQLSQYLTEGGEDDKLRCVTVYDNALGATGDLLTPGATWEPSNARTASYFTAIGAWFALFFRKKFPEIPVGIIHSSWGGTTVLTWLSRSALALHDAGRKILAQDDEQQNRPSVWIGAEDLNAPPRNSGVSDRMLSLITQKDPGNKGFDWGYASIDFDDSDWKLMAIPGSWINQKISTQGSVWIRYSVELPESWVGQPLEIHLGGVDKMDQTYFNGVKVGATGADFDQIYWNRSRKYAIPAELAKAGKNTVAVRAYSFYWDGAFTGPVNGYYLKNLTTDETIELGGIQWKAKAEYAFVTEQMDGSLIVNTNNPNAPHRLFDNKIRPLIPYGIRGVLWYQGESDTDTPERTAHYLERFCDMVRDWRYRWGQGDDFPFYSVQLANFRSDKPDRWLTIQDMQRRSFFELPNTGVITASDLALFEPHDIHPHDKRSFGYRLFLLALANVYGEKNLLCQGPTMDKIRKEGETLFVHFLYADGLHTKDGGPVKGFEVAEANGAYVPAQAWIVGDEVKLIADGYDIIHARYNAKVDLPEGNLVNSAELPALSFIE